MFSVQSFKNIRGAANWRKITPIKEGWSFDQKFKVDCMDGQTLLLRISDQKSLKEEKLAYDSMQELAAFNLAIPEMVEAGLCNNGQNTYRIFTWLEGRPAIEVLPELSAQEQYGLGLEAGLILKKIHSLGAAGNRPKWATFFNQKLDYKINSYKKGGFAFEQAPTIINFIEKERFRLEDRPMTFHHGDFHLGNMLVTEKGQLAIIDFNRLGYGDPWEEFNRIVWSASQSPHFAKGQIKAYFREPIPTDFFPLMALYIAVNQIGAFAWAADFGEKEAKVHHDQTLEILGWYNNFTSVIPTWYSMDEFQ